MSKLVVNVEHINNNVRYTTEGWNNLIVYVTDGELKENSSDVNATFSVLEYDDSERVILIRASKGAGYWYKHIPYYSDMSYQLAVDLAISNAGLKPLHSTYTETVTISCNDIHPLMGPHNKEPTFRSLISEVPEYVCSFQVPADRPVNEHGNWCIHWTCNRVTQHEIYMNAQEYLNAPDRAAYFRDEVIQNWELTAKTKALRWLDEIKMLIMKRDKFTQKRKVK